MAKKLFVGNLSWNTTDASLSQFFAQFGSVVSANVITDKFSGKSKGFGFVEMSTDEEAVQATEKANGQDLDGRAISVSEARPPKPRDNSGGGFGGGRRDSRGGGGFDRGHRDDRRRDY